MEPTVPCEGLVTTLKVKSHCSGSDAVSVTGSAVLYAVETVLFAEVGSVFPSGLTVTETVAIFEFVVPSFV